MVTVGQAVLARREPEAPLEPALVKSVREDVVSVRFDDGYLLPGLARDDVRPLPDEADSTKSVAEDAEYDAAVGPLLPVEPDEPSSAVAFAKEYKAVGNTLFSKGQHEWALRTYVAAVDALARIGFGRDATRMAYDLEANPVCIACFSNAALCALKLQKHAAAVELCERAERFNPSGADLGKVLLRKATALLEAPTGGDADAAVVLLERAAAPTVLGRTRPVVELLQRAKKAAKERQRAADRCVHQMAARGGIWLRRAVPGSAGLRLMASLGVAAPGCAFHGGRGVP